MVDRQEGFGRRDIEKEAAQAVAELRAKIDPKLDARQYSFHLSASAMVLSRDYKDPDLAFAIVKAAGAEGTSASPAFLAVGQQYVRQGRFDDVGKVLEQEGLSGLQASGLIGSLMLDVEESSPLHKRILDFIAMDRFSAEERIYLEKDLQEALVISKKS